jgi:hypothetical protein
VVGFAGEYEIKDLLGAIPDSVERAQVGDQWWCGHDVVVNMSYYWVSRLSGGAGMRYQRATGDIAMKKASMMRKTWGDQRTMRDDRLKKRMSSVQNVSSRI